MEHSPFPPRREPFVPKKPRPAEGGGFSAPKPRQAPEKAPNNEQQNPKIDTPVSGERQAPPKKVKFFGRRLIEAANTTSGHAEETLPNAAEQQPRNEPKPEVEPKAKIKPEAPQAETEQSSEQEQIIATAERLRKFARIIIERVAQEVRAEPERAQQAAEAPIDTEPLAEAADELREATNDLTEAVEEVQQSASQHKAEAVLGMESPWSARGDSRHETHETAETPVAPTNSETQETAVSFDNGYDSPEPQAVTEPTVAERIASRVSRLERGAEVETNTTALALMLGAIAVIATGFERGSRRRGQAEIKKTSNQQAKRIEIQQKQIQILERDQQNQQALYDDLRLSQANAANRNQRENYYGKLGEITHKQSELTHEATKDLQGLKTENLKKSENPEAALASVEAFWRTHSERDAAEGVSAEHNLRIEQTFAASETSARRKSPEVIFESTNSNVALSGAGQHSQPAPQKQEAKAPLSPAALQEINARKARRDHLAANTWLYGLGLMLAILGLLAALALTN